MNRLLFVCVMAFTLIFGGMALGKDAAAANPMVKVETSEGSFVVELYPEKARQSVLNFLFYVKSGYYNNTIFHRVIPGFVIQGGGFDKDMVQKETSRKAVENEANNGLSNEPYTLAMARTQDPHSATSQFYVNLGHNKALDFKSPTPQGYGYAVFGKVVKGMDVVDQIAAGVTGNKKGHQNVPVKPVTIISVSPME